MLRKRPSIRRLSPLFGIATIVACSASEQSSGVNAESARSSQSALSSAQTFSLPFPAGVVPSGVAVSANGFVNIDNFASVRTTGSGVFANIANTGILGTTGVHLGASVGGVVSQGAVGVDPGATVHGDVRSGGPVFQALGSTVTGAVTQNATLTPFGSVTWTSPAPGPSAGDVNLLPTQTLALPPGSYRNLNVPTAATIQLSSGVYFFSALNLSPLSVVSFSGPTVVYVSAAIIDGATFKDTIGDASLLVAYSGFLAVAIGGPFIGSFVAPNASIVLGSQTHTGAFFAHDVDVSAGATVVHRSFPLPPSSCIGQPDGTACAGTGSPGASTCRAGTCVTINCGDVSNSSGDTKTMTASADFGGGVVTYTQTSASPVGSSPSDTVSITQSTQALYTQTVVGQNSAGVTTGSTIFGPGVRGLHEIDASTDGTTVNATVDGRALQPIAVSAFQNPTGSPAIVFADGQPAPVLSADDGVFQTIAKMATLAAESVGACGLTPQPIRVLSSPGSIPFELPGEVSNPNDFAVCQKCQGDCNGSFLSCTAGASAAGGAAGAGATALPPGADIVGEIIAVVGVTIAEAICGTTQKACSDNCNAPGQACCVVTCGSSACCGPGETCLDAAQGLCCGAAYSTCGGPLESCVDKTQAVCLTSGAGCPNNVPTCGTGPNQICCPSGVCNGNQCVPPSTFGIVANATGTPEGPKTCISGTGFTPGARVTITYTGLPIPFGGNFTGGSATGPSATVAADGTWAVTDEQFAGTGGLTSIDCSNSVLNANATVTAVDGSTTTGHIGTGQPTTAPLPDSIWCKNVGGSFGSGCP